MKKKELTFLPSEHKTSDELLQQIEERNEKMLKNIDDIRKHWHEFKADIKDIENRKKVTDYKVYTYCFGGIAICTILLLILELSK